MRTYNNILKNNRIIEQHAADIAKSWPAAIMKEKHLNLLDKYIYHLKAWNINGYLFKGITKEEDKRLLLSQMFVIFCEGFRIL